MISDDPRDDREAEPRPPGLGRELGIEEPPGILRFESDPAVSDLQEALSWWESHPNDSVLVTAEGDLVAQDGTLWGGSRAQQISILGKQEERKTLEAKVASSGETLRAKQQKLRKIEQQLAKKSSD